MKKIILLIAFLLTANLGYGQYFEKHSGVLASSENTFTATQTFDTIRVNTIKPLTESWRLTDKSRFLYEHTLHYEKDTGSAKFVIKTKEQSLGSAALITFETWATTLLGTDTTTGNSYMGQAGRSFYFMNMSYNGEFFGGNGHDRYKLVFDSNEVQNWSALNSVKVGGSITSFRDPLGSGTNRRFYTTSNDSVAGQSRNWNFINKFSNYVGWKLTGTLDITFTNWISEIDSSINFVGSKIRPFKFNRDGKALEEIDGDTNQRKVYDYISPNPIYYTTELTDSMNTTDLAKYLRNTFSTNIMYQLQNTTTTFASNRGGRLRMNGSIMGLYNLENAITVLSTNGNNNIILETTGMTTFMNNLNITWAANVTAGFFRGTTDTDITGFYSRTPNGTLKYVWVDDAGAVQTSSTIP